MYGTHRDAPDPHGPHAYGGTPWRVSYTLREVVLATGVSERTVAYALERGDLLARYPSSRPVVLHRDLVAWLETAPTTRAEAPRRPAKVTA
jgi:hypothetical protein